MIPFPIPAYIIYLCLTLREFVCVEESYGKSSSINSFCSFIYIQNLMRVLCCCHLHFLTSLDNQIISCVFKVIMSTKVSTVDYDKCLSGCELSRKVLTSIKNFDDLFHNLFYSRQRLI